MFVSPSDTPVKQAYHLVIQNHLLRQVGFFRINWRNEKLRGALSELLCARNGVIARLGWDGLSVRSYRETKP